MALGQPNSKNKILKFGWKGAAGDICLEKRGFQKEDTSRNSGGGGGAGGGGGSNAKKCYANFKHGS